MDWKESLMQVKRAAGSLNLLTVEGAPLVKVNKMKYMVGYFDSFWVKSSVLYSSSFNTSIDLHYAAVDYLEPNQAKTYSFTKNNCIRLPLTCTLEN